MSLWSSTLRRNRSRRRLSRHSLQWARRACVAPQRVWMKSAAEENEKLVTRNREVRNRAAETIQAPVALNALPRPTATR